MAADAGLDVAAAAKSVVEVDVVVAAMFAVHAVALSLVVATSAVAKVVVSAVSQTAFDDCQKKTSVELVSTLPGVLCMSDK